MTCIDMQPKCKRACDRCRFKRVRCLREGECCSRCIKDGKTCLFTDQEKKRGPKPKQSSSNASNSPDNSGSHKKRRRETKHTPSQLLLSPLSDSSSNHSDPILSSLYFGSTSPHGDWSEHMAHTQTFFSQMSDVASYIQSFIRLVDPSHTLVSQQSLQILNMGFCGSIPPTMDMMFLLRCMAATTILISTNNPLDDLFLVHYDMAVKALPHTSNQEFLSCGITLLNFIDLTMGHNNNVTTASKSIYSNEEGILAMI